MMTESSKRSSINEHGIPISIKHRRTGEFLPRKSLLTDLFQISHINCIRNAFAAGFIIMILQHTVNDLIQYGR